MTRVSRPLILGVLVLVSMALASALRADEAPAARAYMDWLDAVVTGVEQDVATMAASADLAAKAVVDGRKLCVRGDLALRAELVYRAGGLALADGGAGEAGDVILYALGVATRKPGEADAKALLENQLADAEKLHEQGGVVVGIASHKQLQSLKLLERATRACTLLLDNHAPAADGMIVDPAGHAWIPTFVTANPVVMWAWTSELFAACTRLGKTPVVLQSMMVEGASKRNERYKKLRFHEDVRLPVIAPGVLGKAYTANLRAVLLDVGTASWKSLVRTCDRATNTLLDGGRVMVHAVGHYPPAHHGGQLPADPGLFTRLTNFTANLDINDFVLIIGYSWLPGDKFWGPNSNLDTGGRGAAYVIAAHRDPRIASDAKRIIVDQQWAEGDALVPIPGYDVRMGPPSGVTSEAILWAVTAQVRENVQSHQATLKHKP